SVNMAQTGSGQVSSYADALRKILSEQNETALDTNTNSSDARYKELERKYLDGSISPQEADELWRLERVKGQLDASREHDREARLRQNVAAIDDENLAKNSDDRYTQIDFDEESKQRNYGPIEEDNHGRKEITGNQRGNDGAQTENGDRSRVQGAIRSDREIAGETSSGIWERHGRLIRQGVEYNLPVHIVKESEWNIENVKSPAYSRNGEIYINENVPPDQVDMLIPHESTHVMRQLKFAPYVEFLGRTPEMLNIFTEDGRKIFEQAAKHRNIDPFDMTYEQANILYDEINATVCGVAILNADSPILANLRNAFYDYDGYKRELQSIHQQFKDARKSECLEYTHYQELERKFLEGTLKSEEEDELWSLENIWG
ncbi:MAG: hypothetical protein IKB53_01935, partial [Oscillospiraceae bacterium]|nr:hypothetical protein [Oscillospiraceae bacterium]